MTAPSCRIEEREQALIFTITRPQRLNAITSEVLDGLTACIDKLETQSGNRGLILTAQGERAFCAGTDLFERETMNAVQRQEKSDRARDLIVRLNRAPFISIAALNGLAYGGGLELAMSCVFRIASPHVECALPEVKIGLIPAYAGTQLLPAIVGQSRALDMMLTGRAVGAGEALQMGLLNRVVENNSVLLEHALAYLASITCYSKVAINGIRQAAVAAGPQLDEHGLKVEREMVIKVGSSEDAREGVAAFSEKRKPRFQHR